MRTMNAFNAYRYLCRHRNHSVTVSGYYTYQIEAGNIIKEMHVEKGKPICTRTFTSHEFILQFSNAIFTERLYTLYEQV